MISHERQPFGGVIINSHLSQCKGLLAWQALPTDRGSDVLAPDADGIAFDRRRTIVAGHQHDERSRRLVGARVLASDILGESRKHPALAFPVRAHTRAPGVSTENSNPDGVVMEPADDGERFDAPGPLNRARDRRIFIQ